MLYNVQRDRHAGEHHRQPLAISKQTLAGAVHVPPVPVHPAVLRVQLQAADAHAARARPRGLGLLAHRRAVRLELGPRQQPGDDVRQRHGVPGARVHCGHGGRRHARHRHRVGDHLQLVVSARRHHGLMEEHLAHVHGRQLPLDPARRLVRPLNSGPLEFVP